jgi:hypothetical protein
VTALLAAPRKDLLLQWRGRAQMVAIVQWAFGRVLFGRVVED